MPSQIDPRGRPCSYIKGQFQNVATRYLPIESVQALRARVFDAYLAEGYALTGNQELEANECFTCHMCYPLRYAVADFKGTREHQKIWRINNELGIQDKPDGLSVIETAEHSALCNAFQKNRFPEKYHDERAYALITTSSLKTGGVKIGFVSIRDGRTRRLVGGLQYAQGARSLYGMHYYYDTAMKNHMLGKLLILVFIEVAKKQDRDYAYVGEWIPEFKHFGTKTQFQPYEIFVSGHWQRHETSLPFDRASAPPRLIVTS